MNAECKPVDHSPQCSCLLGYSGNPWVQCVKGSSCSRESRLVYPRATILLLSPCAELPLFHSLEPPPTPPPPPPTPRPECLQDDDCPDDKACFDRKCQNPCLVRSPCGVNALCSVEYHSPVCTCLPGYQGNPILQCIKGISAYW